MSVVKVCVIVAFLFVSKAVSAQQWAFENMRVGQGLPASETYNMFQDERGYLFVATEYGLVKFNGARFVQICTNIPVRERIAYSFYQNKAGLQYFVNSQFHIYYIHNDSAFRLAIDEKPIPTIPHSYPIKQIFEDNEGNVYVSSLYNHFIFDIKEKKWKIFEVKTAAESILAVEKIKDDYVGSTNLKKCTQIFVKNGAYNGLYKLNSSDLISGAVTVKESSDAIYFISGAQIVRIDRTGKVRSYHTTSNILSLKVSSDNHVWIGKFSSGLEELNGDLKLVSSYLKNRSVADILFDKDGGVWVSTLEEGIYHCYNKHEYHYDNIAELSGGISVLKKINNSLFIGTSSGSLLCMNNTQSKMIKFGKYKMLDIIEWQGKYLVSDAANIFSMNNLFQPSLAVPALSSYQLLARSDKFVCTSPSAFLFFSKQYKKILSIPIEAQVKCLLPVGKDSILFGTTKGLYVFSDSSFTRPKIFDTLQNTSISDLERQNDGRIWIGTKGDGLFVFTQDQRLLSFPSPSQIVTNVSFYVDSFLLLSTNTGLYVKSTNISASNWQTLYNGEVLNAIPFRDKIFVATKHGLIAFDTSHLFVSQTSSVYLSSVSSGKRNIRVDSLVLNHNEKDLYFNFDVLSYNRLNPRLTYRLDGPIVSKGQIVGRQLFLQNLKPGFYTLEVYVGDILENPSLLIPFYIKPAFWQTRIFLLLVISFCIIIIAVSAYYHHRFTKRNAYKKAAISRMLSEYKLTALKAQINPHFISNSLTAIQQLVLSNELDNAGLYLAQFSQLIRQVLQYSDKSLVLLSEELKIIDLNISLEQLRFNNKFRYIQEIDPEIFPSTVYIPPLITQPFIENAIWHGLLPLADKRPPLLRIKIEKNEHNLILSIIDNGVGRKASSKQKSVSNSSFASRGIELTQSRIENLNQIYTTGKAKVVFIDLEDSDEPSGTRVDIILPYLTQINHYNHDKKYNR